jgi:2,4-dienoyl-CoA reductase-like NADH-dependent reductase (Old Yellow Enzyme family)
MSSKLFKPFKIRNLDIKNKIFMAPMCQYSAVDGVPNMWHSVHLGTRAAGGVGLILVEATGINPSGRISNKCLGLYNEAQKNAFKPIVEFIKSCGAVAGIQLNHSGRKGEGDWEILAPSAIAFSKDYRLPREMSKVEIENIKNDFLNSAKLALEAGFQVIEIHMAHGYLMHQFLSPISNKRSDEYGGSFENRIRFPLEIAKCIRDFWPSDLPVFVRISATDWMDLNAWDLEQSVQFVLKLKDLGIDFIDVSTGGNVAAAKIPVGKNYQVPFAKEIKLKTQMLTGAVGLITDAKQAEKILDNNEADVVFLGRVLLRDPYWALFAMKELEEEVLAPPQYLRAF